MLVSGREQAPSDKLRMQLFDYEQVAKRIANIHLTVSLINANGGAVVGQVLSEPAFLYKIIKSIPG